MIRDGYRDPFFGYSAGDWLAYVARISNRRGRPRFLTGLAPLGHFAIGGRPVSAVLFISSRSVSVWTRSAPRRLLGQATLGLDGRVHLQAELGELAGGRVARRELRRELEHRIARALFVAGVPRQLWLLKRERERQRGRAAAG